MDDAVIDVREMLAIHDTFRKEFASLPLMVKSTPVGDADRAAIIGSHFMLLMRMLQSHHEGEDEIAWPLLRERVPADDDLVATMIGQHEALHVELDLAQTQARTWMDDPTVINRASFHTTLIALERALLEHLSTEEQELLPVMARTMSAEEFASLGEHARAGLSQQEMAIALGMITDDTAGELSALILEAMPPEARAGWEQMGRPAYMQYRARLYDTA